MSVLRFRTGQTQWRDLERVASELIRLPRSHSFKLREGTPGTGYRLLGRVRGKFPEMVYERSLFDE
jgi:hypothetical protein